jgi:hypothetical protein
MRIRVQVVIEGDGEVPPEVHEVADLQRGALGRTHSACSWPRPRSCWRECRRWSSTSRSAPA